MTHYSVEVLIGVLKCTAELFQLTQRRLTIIVWLLTMGKRQNRNGLKLHLMESCCWTGVFLCRFHRRWCFLVWLDLDVNKYLASFLVWVYFPWNLTRSAVGVSVSWMILKSPVRQKLQAIHSFLWFQLTPAVLASDNQAANGPGCHTSTEIYPCQCYESSLYSPWLTFFAF